MTKLLFIKASPRRSESRSVAIAEAYLSKLKATTPDLEVDVIDLWEEKLPEFDGNKANAKLAIITKQTHTPEQKSAWDQVVEIIGRFKSADHYLFAVPMWNGGIPYRLKQYIDILHQPGFLFGLNPATGYFGLLEGKRATICYTSGAYSPGASLAFGADYHSTYMKFWLGQAGVTDIKEVRYQPTVLTASPAEDFGKAKAEAEALAI